MAKSRHIIILRSGKMVLPPGRVEDQVIHALGPVEQRRVSHIWPEQASDRLAFKVVRMFFEDKSPVVEWAKRWRVVWTVRWADQPSVVVFRDRSRRKCRLWERQQLRSKFRTGQV